MLQYPLHGGKSRHAAHPLAGREAVCRARMTGAAGDESGAEAERPRTERAGELRGHASASFASGIFRIRLPVAAKIAFKTAGTPSGADTSPMPHGLPSL